MPRVFPHLLILAALFSGTALAGAWAADAAAIVRDASPGPAAKHGEGKLAAALKAAGWDVNIRVARMSDAIEKFGDRILVFTGTASGQGAAADLLRAEKIPLPSAAEGFVVHRMTHRARPAVVICGADDRGLMYGELEVADRIGWAELPTTNPFVEVQEMAEQPFVRDRSLSVYTMNRGYWESRFFDDRYWTRYFDLLAASRFNRFLIVFGYENGGFLAPPYPYFFNTPGFRDVRMADLKPKQQRANLAALNRLIDLAHERGIAVSLGIWDHIYRGAVQTGGAEWVSDYKDRPLPNSVQGVTSENLNAYTLASLKELLVRVPHLDGLQFRVHEESRLKREEVESFWREVFQHVQQQRPGLLLEARAKGTPDAVIATALAQGVNLRVETKYWMEQMGLPFHPTHVNPPNQHDRRHGYADLLRYPQRYQIDWRLWNGGTSRVLLWADPEYVRRYSESTALYDSPNWDVQEPLATKMEAQRPDMAPFALIPEPYRYYDYEFERYWHFFQVWGRLGYNPHASAEIWEHDFKQLFGSAGPHVAAGLHRASEVLPMIVAAVYPYKLFPTTRGWAERQSLGVNLEDYSKNEGTDTEQFENFIEAARRIVAGGITAKRTPDATSRWFDATADAILKEVSAAEATIGSKRGKEFDATVTDLKILAQLARFHARRAIGSVHYNLFKRSLKLGELYAATLEERKAVAAWRELVTVAGNRYSFDLAMGARNFSLCGHWRDELKLLEAGLKELEEQCCPPDEATLQTVVWSPRTTGDRSPPDVEHVRLLTVRAGEPVKIVARVADPSGVARVRLRYRHVIQFEDYETLDLQPTGKPDEYAATVPGTFIVPEWDFMYFLEVIDQAGNGLCWPDLARETPYVIAKVARP